jgi:hypothetical protein
MFETIYNEAEVNREWLKRAPSSYKQWLRELRDSEIKTLKNSENIVMVHRAQGRLDLIDRLINLEKDLEKQPKGVQ